MTYVEYCRMKCFSKIENFNEKSRNELHEKRMKELSKGCRNDNDKNKSSWEDEVACKEGDAEYQKSLKSCKSDGIEAKDCTEAVSNAKDAFSIVRNKPSCNKK